MCLINQYCNEFSAICVYWHGGVTLDFVFHNVQLFLVVTVLLLKNTPVICYSSIYGEISIVHLKIVRKFQQPMYRAHWLGVSYYIVVVINYSHCFLLNQVEWVIIFNLINNNGNVVKLKYYII